MFISLGLSIFFSQPIITYFFAKRMGRNPKKWFLIGMLLPGIASFIVFCLPDLSEEKTEEPEIKKAPRTEL
ncbi:MAG: hypothetical protein ACXVP0_14545 [Bacteroidia bacterium]